MSRTANGTTWDAEFWALILEDDHLVGVEFEALIAAEWPEGASRSLRVVGRRSETPPRDALSSCGEALPRVGVAALDGWKRERAPPA
jgi:hypothetical protein